MSKRGWMPAPIGECCLDRLEQLESGVLMSSAEVEVRESPVGGVGVFALRLFKPGEVVLRWDISPGVIPSP